uniref:lysozyme n=1 Tax=Musca domestica TaxID=7370 RepID=A0A1I8N5P1_MUSDO
MVLIKELNQKIVIAAILVSFGLIVGSIYLHIRQKHHFGRLNIGDDRVHPTTGVDIFPKDGDDTGSTESVIKSTKQFIQNIEEDYSSANSGEYANDESYTTMSQYGGMNSAEQSDEFTSSDSYVVDNDYANDYSTASNVQSFSGNAMDVISDKCLKCLCVTASDCRPVKCQTTDPCGVYGISKLYWIDGGKQVVKDKRSMNNTEEEEHNDYLRCVVNDACAKNTINSYLKRYRRDCNKDGVIDCADFISLHVFGPSGCTYQKFPLIQKFRMNQCLKEMNLTSITYIKMLTSQRKQQLSIAVTSICLILVIGMAFRHFGHGTHFNHKVKLVSEKMKAKEATSENVKIILLENMTNGSNGTRRKSSDNKIQPMDEQCMHCLCTTINDCKPVKCLKTYTCGIFEISHSYWMDSGKTVLNGNLNYYTGGEEEFRDYLQCINDDKCSRETVIKYMQRFQEDCNKDGVIDCYDYIALHLLGPKGCKTQPLAAYHKMRMHLCLK